MTWWLWGLVAWVGASLLLVILFALAAPRLNRTRDIARRNGEARRKTPSRDEKDIA